MGALLLLPFLFLDVSSAMVRLIRTQVELPGATGSVALDYLAADRQGGRVWIPAGETGSVDVLDLGTRRLTRIEGFATKAGARGPSAVSLGDGMAFIGNRASKEICAVDAERMAKLGCTSLAVSPDGMQYVSTTREVWVTAPADRCIAVIDARGSWPGKQVTRIPIDGRPEGYAVDAERGQFFTNLEDKNQTLVIDIRSRKVVSTWNVPCGNEGPRGLAYDRARQFLFVACTDKVVVLDGAHGGARLSTLATGAGVDNIDYLEDQANLYVAAGRAARLTIGHVDAKGTINVVATAHTADGARVVVVAADGTSVVGDPHHGRVLMFSPGR